MKTPFPLKIFSPGDLVIGAGVLIFLAEVVLGMRSTRAHQETSCADRTVSG